MTLLKIENLFKQYPGASDYAVKDFNLEVEKSEIVALLGQSGCGKTTVLRSIAGLEVPDSGYIEMSGNPFNKGETFVPPEKRGIGIVFQDFALFPHLSVFQNIGFGLRERDNKARKERVNYLVNLVGLQGFEDRYPHQLSGGQKQRVALARALAPAPALILMDEPFSSIDAMFKDEMYEEIWKILKETRTTCIFVTHDTSDVMPVADRVALMSNGQVRQFGSPSEMYLRPKDCYVARFFGKTNLLKATVKEGGFQTKIGFIPYEPVPTDREEVILSIRPEGFKIAHCQEEGCLQGSLKNISFHGQYQEIVCSVCGEKFEESNEEENFDITLYVDQMKSGNHFNGQFYIIPRKEHIQVLEC